MQTVVDQPASEARVLTPAAPVVVELQQNGVGETACALPGCEGEQCRVSGCAPKRWAFVGLGSLCFAIAAAGVVLPVVPTTFPLMLSLLFFARSSPMLERKVREFRLFKPYIKYIDGSTPMPMRAKLVSCLLMWTPVSIASWMLFHSAAPDAAWIGTLSLAVIGTPVIFFWRPKLVG
ncbi:MAG: YbaN family protein [Planctomycetota bacterium]